jgi:hypothetical protein
LKMKAKGHNTGLSNEHARRSGRLKSKMPKDNLSGYPAYPVSEDIYSKYQEEKDINPEDISTNKISESYSGTNSEKDFSDDMSGNDLDIPGAELDDEQENIGSEDEENNYYSLGGDDHNDLEEDHGD